MNETTIRASNLKQIFIKHKSTVGPILLLSLATLIFFSNLFLHSNEMMFPSYDVRGIFYYEKLFFVKSIINFHQIPLWNPFAFSGTPFLANPTTAVFYPTSLLFLVFPIYKLFGFLFCVDIFLAGYFTFLYCKNIGLKTFSALLSSTSFMFSGILITLFIPGHLVVLDTVMWFPLLLFLTNRLVQKRSLFNAATLGFVIALLILAGHTQITFYSLVITSIYLFSLLIFNFFKTNRFLFKALALFFISVVIGIGISTIQLLPSLEFALLSARASGVTFEFASSFSIHPYQIVSALLPHFFGDYLVFWGKANFPASSIYIGITPLFFILFSFLKRNKYVIFFTILAIFTFVYATGENMPLFPFLYSLFPKFNSFRVPTRSLYFFVYSLSILSGFGSQNFLNKKVMNIKQLKKTTIGLVTGALIVSIITIFVYSNTNSINLYEEFVLRNSFARGLNHLYIFNLLKNDLFTFCLMLISLTSIILMFIFKKITINTFKILIIFLSLFDLFIFGQTFIRTESPKGIFKADNERKIIMGDKSLYRVFDMEGQLQGLQNDLIPNVTGVHSLYLSALENYIYKVGPHFNQKYESFFLFSDIYNPEILKLLNVKYIITNKLLNNRNLRLILSDNGSFLYELINTYPRIYFSSTKDEKGYYIPEQTDNSVRIISYTPNKIELYVDVKKSERLILSEIYYPGWKAYVNSKEEQIEKVNDIFKSVHVKNGQYKIKFVYDPLSFRLGALVSGLTITLTTIGFIISRKRIKLNNSQFRKRKNKMSTVV